MINDFSSTLTEYSNLFSAVAGKEKLSSIFKEIKLSNDSYFELAIGKRVVKRDLIKISGSIPIYSANVKVPVGLHIKSNISNFNNNFVLWGIDGDFEFNAIPKNTPFVSTDHCGTIRILSDEILPEYLMIQLENVKHKYGFDRGLRASIKNMKEVIIKIPFNEDGTINILKQKEVIEKYEYIKELRNKIQTYKEQLFEINVDFE